MTSGLFRDHMMAELSLKPTLQTSCKCSSGDLRASHGADLLPVGEQSGSGSGMSLRAIISEQNTETEAGRVGMAL